MSIKWAIGAGIAVLSAMFVLPGIVSAHHAELSGEASDCRDAQGAFTIDWTLQSYAPNNRELDGFDEYEFDGDFNNPPPFNENVDQGVLDVVDGSVAPSLTLDDFGLGSDGIHGNGSASAQTAYDGSAEPNPVIYAEGRVQWTSTQGNTVYVEQDIRSNDINRPDYCRENFNICESGDFVKGDHAVNEAAPTGTNDCDPVRMCVDGESVTVTEFDAASLDGDKGSCTPTEDPPTIITTVTEPEPTPVLQQAVLSETPPVDEVVALPAAGYGSTSGSNVAWTAMVALVLVSLGGATALATRRR
jgi:hypothetical protein